MEYKKNSHSVYLLTYHIVFVTKYRKKCISDEIGNFMKELSQRLVKNNGGSVISAETDSDHIHLLIEIPPSIAPGEMVKVLKTQLSKECHQRYKEELQKYLYGEKTPLWSPSYFVATTGTAVMEKVKSYVESQRTDEHKRKYEKTGNYKKKRKYVRKNIEA